MGPEQLLDYVVTFQPQSVLLSMQRDGDSERRSNLGLQQLSWYLE